MKERQKMLRVTNRQVPAIDGPIIVLILPSLLLLKSCSVYWFQSKALQEPPQYIGSAADGTRRDLFINAIPTDIKAYGEGLFPEEIQFGLISFLSNINREITLKE